MKQNNKMIYKKKNEFGGVKKGFLLNDRENYCIIVDKRILYYATFDHIRVEP